MSSCTVSRGPCPRVSARHRIPYSLCPHRHRHRVIRSSVSGNSTVPLRTVVRIAFGPAFLTKKGREQEINGWAWCGWICSLYTVTGRFFQRTRRVASGSGRGRDASHTHCHAWGVTLALERVEEIAPHLAVIPRSAWLVAQAHVIGRILGNTVHIS